METPVQDQLQETITSTLTLMTEPLLLQPVAPISPQATPRDRIQPSPITKPAHWDKMSAREKTNWRNRNK